ncbi:hypothetical protein PanWU01x14_277790 [Parasponia andersonii]|uniref:Uncharacterized protein n=1 Tax=Parasponia andersonii TaxID=3476 RepID=A0A2P5B2G9_PARAD|nr:hypothetical protein PanWU01x14_277790 [Parasponia andersonii]
MEPPRLLTSGSPKRLRKQRRQKQSTGGIEYLEDFGSDWRRRTPGNSRGVVGGRERFLSKCFVKDPWRRWTAEMLLNHAFVGGDDDDDDGGSDDTVLLEEANRISASPRCPFDFPEWVSCTSEPHDSHVVEISPESDYVFLYGSGGSTCIPFSPSDRVRQLFMRNQVGYFQMIG